MKKQLKFLGLLGLMLSMLTGCFSTDNPNNSGQQQPTNQSEQPVAKKDRSEMKIGFSQRTMAAPYYAAMVNDIKGKADELGVKLISVDAQDDMNKQLADIEDMLSQGIDALILNPLDSVGLVPATKAAEKAGVPVFIVDSAIDSAASYVSSIQSNNSVNGHLVGEWLAQQIKGNSVKIALISGDQGSPVGKERRESVLAGLMDEMLRTRGQASVEVASQGWGNWNYEGGLKAMEDILVAHPDVNVLLAENDSMALGAMKAINASGKTGQITIVAAADGQKEALELIKKGEYGATGLNNPRLIGETALTSAVEYLEGKRDFQKVTYTEPAAITKGNVDQYYDPNSGF